MRKMQWAIALIACGTMTLESCSKWDDFGPFDKAKSDGKDVTLEKPDESTPCDVWITFVDEGMCGGVWFKAADGTYLEVYGLSQPREALGLEPGDKISVSYESSTFGGITCQAMTEMEALIYDSGDPVETVQITCEAPKDEEPELPCHEKVVFMDGGLCGGVWFRRADGTYLEVYEYPFDRENPSLKAGDVVTMTVEEVDVTTFIRCQALNEFESNIYSGLKDVEIVQATCY